VIRKERCWYTWGRTNYLDRYKIYVSHVQEWRTQFDKLESVDLRYDRADCCESGLARENPSLRH